MVTMMTLNGKRKPTHPNKSVEVNGLTQQETALALRKIWSGGSACEKAHRPLSLISGRLLISLGNIIPNHARTLCTKSKGSRVAHQRRKGRSIIALPVHHGQRWLIILGNHRWNTMVIQDVGDSPMKRPVHLSKCQGEKCRGNQVGPNPTRSMGIRAHGGGIHKCGRAKEMMDISTILTHLGACISQWWYILKNVPRWCRLVSTPPLDESKQICKK